MVIKVHKNKPNYSTVNEKSPYGRYKDDLKKDFSARCGYCDSPDKIWGGKAGFQIDHFAPKSIFEHLEEEYSNLIYSCPICNRGKSNFWPSDTPHVSIENDEGFAHPCRDEYEEHLGRSLDGRIVSHSVVGSYMAGKMKLNLKRHQLIWLREELADLIRRLVPHIKNSSELTENYLNLLHHHFAYDEILNSILDDRE